MASINPFKKILDKLKVPPHDYKISTELLGQFRVDKVAKELNLESVGRRQGENDLPITSSAAPDSAENSIAERIGEATKKAHDIVENELFTYSSRISNLDFHSRINDIEQLCPIAATDLETEIGRGLTEMQPARRSLLSMEEEYKEFKKQNNLQKRTAKLHTGIKSVMFYMVIALVFFFETFSNGYFLKEATLDGGIAGGIVFSFYFSVINIGFSYLLTYFGIRQLFHIKFLHKIYGFISLAALIGIAIILNLALAHFRDISIMNEFVDIETASKETFKVGGKVLERLRETPFDLSDLKSWLLFSLGMFFSALVSVDFLYFNDLYPGYAPVQKKLDIEMAKYQDAYNDTVDELQDKKDDFHENLDKLNQALSTRFKELSVILANKARLTEMYASHNEQLQIASNHLYSIYYDANRAARSTSPPKRFDKALPKIINIKLSNEVTNKREVDKLEKEIKSIQEYLKKQQVHITKIFETGIAQYKNMDIVSEGVRDE